MRTFLKGTAQVLLVAGAAVAVIPAHATYPYAIRPVRGKIDRLELRLDKRLTADFNKGLLDPLELANLRRDLDAIRNAEEAKRLDPNGGMSLSERQKVLGKLYAFSAQVDKHEADRARRLASSRPRRVH